MRVNRILGNSTVNSSKFKFIVDYEPENEKMIQKNNNLIINQRNFYAFLNQISKFVKNYQPKSPLVPL